MTVKGSPLQILLTLITAESLIRSTTGNILFTKNKQSTDLKQFRNGDIMLAGAMHVTYENQDGEYVFTQSAMQLVETMNMIVDQTNKNDSILPGIKLGTIMIDTCGTDSIALKRVITEVLPLALDNNRFNGAANHTKIPILAGVVGASLSSVSTQLAKLLGVFEIPQISYWSTSAELSDKSRFKYFFRIVPPDTYQVSAMIAFVKEREWNYITVVYDNDAYGVSGYKELVNTAEKNNVCIAASYTFPNNPTKSDCVQIVKKLLKKENSRVVVIFATSQKAELLISAADSLPDSHDRFSWIGSDAWTEFIPRSPENKSYLSSLHGAMGFTPKHAIMPNFSDYMTSLTLQQSEFNISNGEYRNPWFAKFISQRNNCSLSNESTGGLRLCTPNEHVHPGSFEIDNVPIANAVLAMIHAITAYHKEVCEGKPGLCEAMLEAAGTNKLARSLYDYLRNISFTGADGRTFQFDKNQDGQPMYTTFFYDKHEIDHDSSSTRNGWLNVGTYENEAINWSIAIKDKLRLVFSNCSEDCDVGQIKTPQKPEACCWFCEKCHDNDYVANWNNTCITCEYGERPTESRNGCEDLPEQKMEYNTVYSILPIALGAFGLLLTLIITIIYVIYRETAIVRASGKELCFFVLFGVFVTLLNAFPITAYPSVVSCGTSRIILSLGPDIMYVGLLMKTARVVFIFQSKGILSSRTKTYLQPFPYICLTVCVASLQCFVLVVWFVTEPPAPEWKINSGNQTLFFTCKILVEIELLIGLIYPFIIILICTILATVNRNVPTGFKETLYVVFSMYTTCVIWLTFLPIFLTNQSDFPKKLTTVSVALSLSAITILVCLFGPRCFVILFYPEDNTAETVMSRTGSKTVSVKERSKSN